MFDTRKELKKDGGITTSFTVNGDSANLLKGVVVMALSDKPALYYKIEKAKLLLYRSERDSNKEGVTKLPYPLDAENGFDFIHKWMQNVPIEEKQGNGDGFGFEAKHSDWDSEAWLEIEAIKIYYSK